MRSTYQGMTRSTRSSGMHHRFGLTDPAAIAAYVARRVEDPALLTRDTGPSYADFFVAPQLQS